MAFPRDQIAKPLCCQSHWTTELRTPCERLRILVSRGTEGARIWQQAQDSKCQGDSELLALVAIASRKGPCTEEGFLVLTGDGATAPLSAQAAEDPTLGLPRSECSPHNVLLSCGL